MTATERIPIAGPWITEREIRYVTDAVTRCWYQHANDYVSRFENAFAQSLGMPYALALPSCTSGIHLALLALGIGPGDEVIVPDVTWIATSAPIAYVGADPVFTDIDEANWCLSVDSLEQSLSSKTKAVIAVDLYGCMPDWKLLRTVCDERGIPLIEDAAEAIGSKLDGVPAGAFGDISVFSFHGTKTLTTGEGGMLVTRSRQIYERAKVLRDHGRNPEDPQFFNREIACKYKMSDLCAALGLAQLERLDELVARKRAIMEWYRQELQGDARLVLNPAIRDVENSYWMSTVLLSDAVGVRKEQVVRRLAERGIDARPFFYPLSSLPAYHGTEAARRGQSRNFVAQRIAPYGVNLPSALNLTREQVSTVATALREILDEADRHVAADAA
jgi:perosamine synthetase